MGNTRSLAHSNGGKHHKVLACTTHTQSATSSSSSPFSSPSPLSTRAAIQGGQPKERSRAQITPRLILTGFSLYTKDCRDDERGFGRTWSRVKQHTHILISCMLRASQTLRPKDKRSQSQTSNLNTIYQWSSSTGPSRHRLWLNVKKHKLATVLLWKMFVKPNIGTTQSTAAEVKIKATSYVCTLRKHRSNSCRADAKTCYLYDAKGHKLQRNVFAVCTCQGNAITSLSFWFSWSISNASVGNSTISSQVDQTQSLFCILLSPYATVRSWSSTVQISHKTYDLLLLHLWALYFCSWRCVYVRMRPRQNLLFLKIVETRKIVYVGWVA